MTVLSSVFSDKYGQSSRDSSMKKGSWKLNAIAGRKRGKTDNIFPFLGGFEGGGSHSNLVDLVCIVIKRLNTCDYSIPLFIYFSRTYNREREKGKKEIHRLSRSLLFPTTCQSYGFPMLLGTSLWLHATGHSRYS